MKKPLHAILALFLVLPLVIPTAAFALSEPTAEFDPNFILSDEELQNWNSMNRADIQAFLGEKNSYLQEYRTEGVDGITRQASDIIYQAAQEHQINPKYLLVKLQKEQSLITDPAPTQKQLDWATGYGVCDSCSLSDPGIQKYKGFGTQIDSAAGIMRWYYDNMYQESWIRTLNNTYVIDDTEVHPASNATGFLYTYTPHLHGNENFWKLWQIWFDQVYPNGTLVKTSDSPTVYLIQNGMKRGFSSMTALLTRFDQKLILTIPTTELNRYEAGPSIALPNYAILKNGNQYYLLDFDTLRPFESAETVRALGYNPAEIIDVTDMDVAGYTIGRTVSATDDHPLGRVVRVKETSALYYLDTGTYHPIPDERMIKVNFPHLSIQTVPAETLYTYESGPAIVLKNGTVFGVLGSNKIYVAEDGKKRHIADEAVFNGLGYKWNTIIWVNEFAGLAHADGEPIYLRADAAPATNTNVSPTPTKPKSVAPVSETSSEEDNASLKYRETVMIRTPKDQTTITGSAFTTDVDAYLIADYKTNEILAGKNIDTVRPLASLTKTMTAYRLLKADISMSKSTEYIPEKHAAKYNNYKISAGERVRNRHLLYALLISSVNTPAYMLVDNVAATPEEFVKGMNDQAREWGLTKTHFSDPYGGEENVTTAREYLTLFTKAIENQDLKDILGMRSYAYDELVDLDGKPHHSDVNSNKLMNTSGLPFTIIASKTGYLYESGSVLAMLVERKSDGKQLIVITMGNVETDNRFVEPERLTRWALETF